MKREVAYLRDKLAEARKIRGGVANIVRAVEIDRRTLDRLDDETHTPHITTINKLMAYFKRMERRKI